MKWIAILFLWCFGLSAQAKDWTDDERKMFIASQMLITADWLQTRNIARNPDSYKEYNPILGEHPTVGSVNVFFLSQLVGNYYLTEYFAENRMVWLQVHNVIRGGVVVRNASIGISMRF